MVRITVEMWPFGIEKNKHTISTLNIANDGSGDAITGNYFAWFDDDRTKVTIVKNFARNLMVWHLIKRVLDKAL